MTPPTDKSEFVNISGESIDIGEHGENDFVFQSGEPVLNAGASDFVYESGTGLGGTSPVFPPTNRAFVRLPDPGTSTRAPEWPMTAADTGATWSPSGAGPLSEPTLGWATAGVFGKTVTASGGRVFLLAGTLSFDNGTSVRLVALDAETGDELWSWSPPETYGPLPNEVLAVDSEDGVVYSIIHSEGPFRLVGFDTATGDVVVDDDISGHVGAPLFLGPAVVADGVVLTTASFSYRGVGAEGTVGGIDADAGEIAWSRKTNSGDFGTVNGHSVDMVVLHSGAPATGDGNVYTAVRWDDNDTYTSGPQSYGVAALDIETGEPVWYRQDCESLIGRVAYHDGGVFVGAQRYEPGGGPLESVTRLDPNTGAVEWGYYADRPGDYAPENPKLLAVGGGRVAAIAGNDSHYYRQASVLDTATGEPLVEKFGYDAPTARNSRCVLTNESLYLTHGGLGDPKVMKCLDPDTLDERWRAPLGQQEQAWIVDGGSVYAHIRTNHTDWYDEYR